MHNNTRGGKRSHTLTGYTEGVVSVSVCLYVYVKDGSTQSRATGQFVSYTFNQSVNQTSFSQLVSKSVSPLMSLPISHRAPSSCRRIYIIHSVFCDFFPIIKPVSEYFEHEALDLCVAPASPYHFLLLCRVIWHKAVFYDWQNKPLFLVAASHLVACGIAFISSEAYKCN